MKTNHENKGFLLHNLPLAAAFGVASAAFGLTEVTETPNIDISASGTGVTATTVKLHGIPSDVPTPIFWFDCQNTNGWTIVRGADGTNYVSDIPSLVGDGRFLTTNTTLEGTSFTGWGSVKPKPPMLVTYGDLPGGPVLDFGRFGSRRALLFNPHESTADAGKTKNQLDNIGAMVAVWGSQEGGGYLFGGGNLGVTAAEDYRWARAYDDQTGDTSVTVKYWTAVLGGYRGTMANAPGFYMHDGFIASANQCGMNGGWESIGLSADEAKWSATGIGVGDTRAGFARDGGLRVAEMLVFGELLTPDQMRRLQQVLREKWMGRGLRGFNGDANLGILRVPSSSVYAHAIVDAPADETLTLRRLSGGRGGAPFSTTAAVKTGEGTLKLDDAKDFTAPVVLQGGKLQLDRKTAPTSAAELPHGLYMRFDASVASSMTLEEEGGTNFIVRMDNLAEGFYKNKPIYLKTYEDRGDLRPWLRTGPLAADMPLVDFGPRKTGLTNGRYFCFCYDNKDGVATQTPIYGCGTLVAMVCAEWGGGHIANGPYQRYERWATAYYQRLINANPFGDANIANDNPEARLYVDGIRRAVSSGYAHAGCQVVAFQVQPGTIGAIGAEQQYTATEGSAAGGLMFGEMLFWNRPLSDDELVAAQEYLSRKWLGKDVPGYSGAVADVADVQSVTVTEPSAIEVPAGQSVKVGRLEARCALEKRGGGTLLVGEGSDLSGLSVKEGEVRVVRAEPAVTETCQLAAGAAFHLDASKLNSLVLEERGGTNFVRRWYSPNGVGAYQATAQCQPWLRTDADAALNGMPVVDFGVYKGEGCVAEKWMPFDMPFDSVRAAFIVRGSQEGGGMLLGEYGDGVSDWGRSGNMVGTLTTPIANNASDIVKNGEFYLDGVRTNCNQALPTGGYEIIDVHPVAGTYVSALACYKGSRMRGGMRVAEVILYDRPLSAREKVATRNYLVHKWFPERALQELPPEEPLDNTVAVRDIALDGTVEMDLDEPMAAGAVTGEGTLVKTGAATLSVRDLSDTTGTIDVQEGTFAITGRAPAAEPALVTDGRIAHFDAAYGTMTVTNADFTVSLTNWVSRTEDGWTAVPGPSYGTTTVHPPSLMSRELNQLPVVRMRYLGWNAGQEYMLFRKDGEQTMLGGIRSVFWVIGSQEGGGFVMGGGVNPVNSSRYVWHRGGNITTNAADAIVINHAQSELQTAAWRRNGVDIKPSAGLTGGYDVLSMVMKEDAVNAATADGFAFDGRIFLPEDYRGRTGRQRLAEVIAYDRRLSDEERAQVEAYLSVKWGFVQKATTNAATVCVAAGATLATGSGQYVDGLGGAGAVQGDVTVRRFVRDCTATGALAVDGTLTIAARPVIALDNLTAAATWSTGIVVASATAFAGAANLADAVFVGVPPSWNPHAVVRNGCLVVRFSHGMQIFFR